MSKNSDAFISLDCPRCGAALEIKGDLFVCQHCGARLILKRSERTGASRSAKSSTVPVGGHELKPFAYFDPQSGLEAFSILVPVGWQVNGGVTWVLERPAAPAQVALQLFNPDGLEAFEVLPMLYFTWTNNPMIQMTKPTGSLHFGYEVCPPMAARDVLRQVVLPRFRRVQDMAVVDEGPADELLQAATRNASAGMSPGQYSADSARIRLHYALNQRPVAEEISGVTEYTRLSSPGMFGSVESVFWSMGYLSGFRASREHIESYADLYRAIFTSIKINPAWTAVVQQVSQGLTKNTIRGIQQIGALSRQISRNYQEMSEENMRGWQERSAISDRISENFSQMIRGVDPYYDPNIDRVVELPSGFNQVWSTPLGEYVLSDDPNFNPNIGSTQTWTPLAPPEKS